MKKLYRLSFLLLMAFPSFAQQIGMYNHYFYKPMIYNPAFTGTGDATNIFLITRSQWAGFKNSPQLNIASVDGNTMDKKVGLGFGVITDRKGLTNRIGANISYSYCLNFNDDTHLRFGISLGVIDQTIDYSKAVVENNSDPTLFKDVQRKSAFDGSGGLAFNWKNLEFGAAALQLIGNKINYVENTDNKSSYTQTRHYIGSLKYKIIISKSNDLSITPLVLVRFVPKAPFQYDANLNFDWNNKLWLGATYKNDYGVSANVGFRIHKLLCVGYSYDVITSNIGKYSGIAHELMLNFKFGKKENQPVVAPVAASTTEQDLKAMEDKYEERLDSIENLEKINQEKIKELTKQLEQQKLQQQQLQLQQQQQQNNQTGTPTGNNNSNKEPVVDNSDKIMENGVGRLTSQTKDFSDAQNHEPSAGFYVIVGTFFYRDFAQAETKRFIDRGYNAQWMFHQPKELNYIYIAKTASKEEAVKKAKQMQANGVPEAWVLELVK